MEINIGVLWRAACLSLLPLGALAQTSWRPVEQVQTYNVSGQSGVELYASIGEHGPKIGSEVRTIAFTNFKLTWTRKYEPQPNGACTLTTAIPKLVITYMLPKASSPMPAELKKKWDVFLAGVRKHEQLHGVIITDMVKEIERVSIGLSAANDPKCSKVRADLQVKLGEISKAQRLRSVDYDRMEMGDGGNVHQLILNLVNGK